MNKLVTLIKLHFVQAFEYRGDFIMYTISYAVQPVVYLLVWLAVSNSSRNLPMSSQEFAQYYIWLLVVQVWVSAWASQFISSNIRHGRLSPYLVKPVAYIFYNLGNNFGEKILKTFMTVPLVVILYLIFRPTWPDLTLNGWIIFVWAWAMAGGVYFLIDQCVGCLAFWFDETSAIDSLYNLTHSVFSGVLVPLVLMPDFMRNIATFLPFRYSLSFPMEILLGKLSVGEQLSGLILQTLFIFLLFVAYRQLWSRGIKKYSAYGN